MPKHDTFTAPLHDRGCEVLEVLAMFAHNLLDQRDRVAALDALPNRVHPCEDPADFLGSVKNVEFLR